MIKRLFNLRPLKLPLNQKMKGTRNLLLPSTLCPYILNSGIGPHYKFT